jgi:DNA-binding NtrC family response regulator
MGGEEAFQALLKLDPAVKVILTSGYANDPTVLAPESFGFKAALAKPFNADELQEVISRVVGPGDNAK